MSVIKKLISSLSQTEKAELYNSFLMKFNTDDAAREVLDRREKQSEAISPGQWATNTEALLEKVLVAYTLDAMRKAAESAGRVRSPRKARAARTNGRKGGRPRKTAPGAQETAGGGR